MGKIESVEREIKKFSAEELAAFRSWFAEFDALVWDEQFERDVASGKLVNLPKKLRRNCVQVNAETFKASGHATILGCL